jgi:thiosulfate/3-mercaptopyruvate sulfurtransferase
MPTSILTAWSAPGRSLRSTTSVVSGTMARMYPLISVAELAEHLDGCAVLDVRWRLSGRPGVADYRLGHIPGAAFLDLDADLAGAPGGPAGGRHPLPEPSRLQDALRRAGVLEDATVVAYDDADGSVAARAWWLLRWAGHESVAVLDGGFAAWEAGGCPISTWLGDPPRGDVVVRPGRMPVVEADEALTLASRSALLDARAPERYRGDAEPVDTRAGHIPGARNAPFACHTCADGRWRTGGQLAERFAEIGVHPGDEVGAYCGSGVTASSVVLALELAGIGGAALYPGSWSEYSAQPGRKVATGAAPGGDVA